MGGGGGGEEGGREGGGGRRGEGGSSDRCNSHIIYIYLCMLVPALPRTCNYTQ